MSSDDPARVIGYNIYQTTDPDLPKSQWKRLNDELLPEAEITQNVSQLEPGVTYYTYMTSVDSEGVESKPSEVMSATMPSERAGEPEWPEVLGGE